MKRHPHYKPAETFPKTCSLNMFMSDLKNEKEKCVWKKVIYLQQQDLAVGLQITLTVRNKVIKCTVGANNPNFLGRTTGFKKAAAMQERNTSIAIQKHWFNTWQQLKE